MFLLCHPAHFATVRYAMFMKTLALLIASLCFAALACGPAPSPNRTTARALSQAERRTSRTASRNIRHAYARRDTAKLSARTANDDTPLRPSERATLEYGDVEPGTAIDDANEANEIGVYDDVSDDDSTDDGAGGESVVVGDVVDDDLVVDDRVDHALRAAAGAGSR